MIDLKLWRQFVKTAKADYPELPVSWEQGARKALSGKCPHAARVLAVLIGGEYRRGFYQGKIDYSDVFRRITIEPNGTMQHSWVEKDGRIYDPTYWQFDDDALGVYIWEASDSRYKAARKDSMSEQVTVIEEWHGDTRTRYTLNADGRKELMDIETISPRPFVRLNLIAPAWLNAPSLDLEEYQ